MHMLTHAHTHAHKHTHACTPHTHTRTYARTHTCTHPHTAILKWFIEVVEAVLKKPNELIDEDQVEVCPENLPDVNSFPSA